MKLDSIINKLRTDCTLATEVEFAISVNAPTDNSVFTSLFVTPVSEKAEKSRADNYVRQTIEASFSVTIGTSTTTDSLTAIRTQVFNSLLGFVPNIGYDAIEFDEGGLLDVSNGIIWWKDVFIMNYFIRQQ